MTRREKGGQSTADAILDAAIELFIESGFEQTSMDAIAEAADVAKGTLYYHFSSKEGLVEAIIERYASSCEAALEEIVRDTWLDALQKLEQMNIKQVELNEASFTKLHRMKFIDIHLRTQRVMIGRFAPLYARVIEEGNAAGIFHCTYPLEYAQISLASSSILFDPESLVPESSRLAAAIVLNASQALGIEEEKAGKVFESVFHLNSSCRG